MRIREPKTTALIFKSGKMVITGVSNQELKFFTHEFLGAKSEELAKNAARKYAKIVAKLGYAAKIKYKDFKIQSTFIIILE